MPERSTEAADPAIVARFLNRFAYFVPLEKFVYYRHGAWSITEPVGKDGILHYLIMCGCPVKDARAMIGSHDYLMALAAAPRPGAPHIFRDAADGELGAWVLNTYVAPTLQPAPGEYPTISRAIDHLTGHDPAGAEWLCHWLAAKIQNPLLVPKVAVVFATEPGAGKGLLAAVIQEMLGQKNCATIQRHELENHFNSRWISKMFVLADEVLSADNLRDVSQTLKVFIDGNELEYEAKHERQRAVRNHLAWMFASNDKVTPVIIESGDRRYSVFTNHARLEPDYVDALNGCFEADRVTHTERFREEMAAFYYDLLHLEVDRGLIARPYQNDSRAHLIEASLPSHEAFFRHVRDSGIDDLLEGAVTHDFSFSKTRSEWDFGEEGVATNAIYKAYQEFCRRTGAKPLKLNRFGHAIRHYGAALGAGGATPDGDAWSPVRLAVPNSTRRVNGYRVPRASPAQPANPAK